MEDTSTAAQHQSHSTYPARYISAGVLDVESPLMACSTLVTIRRQLSCDVPAPAVFYPRSLPYPESGPHHCRK